MLDRCSAGPPAPTYSFTFGLFLWSSVLPHMMLLRCTRFCIILRVLENTKGCSCYLQAHFLFVSGYLFHFSNSCRSTPQEPILILSDTLQTFISLEFQRVLLPPQQQFKVFKISNITNDIIFHNIISMDSKLILLCNILISL